jgi:hypothetical protein
VVTAGTQSLVNTTTGVNSGGPVMVATADGGYFTAWHNYSNQNNGTNQRVYGQWFDANGNKVGAQVAIGTSAREGDLSMDQPPMDVLALANGKVVVTWTTENMSVGSFEVAQSVVSNAGGTLAPAPNYR